MSVEQTSASSSVARVLSDSRSRDAQSPRAQASAPVFELPELSPEHRQSAQAKGDTGQALQQATERYNGDGLSDEQFLRSDARQLSSNERKVRTQETALPEKAQTPVLEGEKAQAEASSQVEAVSEKAASKDEENVAADAPESDAQVSGESPPQELDKDLQNAVDENLGKYKPMLGIDHAMTTDSMIQAPVQPQPTQARTATEEISSPRSAFATQANAGLSEQAGLRAGMLSESRQDAGERQQSRQDGDARQSAQDLRNARQSAEAPAEPRQVSASADKPAFAIQGSNNQSQPSQSPVQAEIISNIMRQVERMREQGRTALQINIPLPDGQEMKMTLRMTENRVQVKLDAQSEELLDEIRAGWADLTDRAARSGIRLDNPLFPEQDDALVGDSLSRHA